MKAQVIAAALTGAVVSYGYLGIAGLVFVESFGIPAPGETAIIAGGVYAGHGQLNIFGVALAAFLAAVIGDSLGYLIGRTGGRRLILRFGRYLRITPARLDRVEAFMARHGPKVVVAARFIEGLRQLNGVVAGVTEMPWRRFVVYNAIGAAAWVGVWASVGYLAGNHIATITATVHRYLWFAVAAFVVAVAGYVLVHRSRRRRQRLAMLSQNLDSQDANAADGLGK